ncbi:J domain-containing protein [Pedomonas mirosovicensis]|uniref:J domain-containing protein n=1 Tax=Pedomonas mirosovicensis TaxID=2908641 RepID=UPI0021672F59|nr:DnaJ domain-containing protein [Pedomonas mirosovicensis]MCH8683855.1 DnaJ domain-containing protein [Pedomonas mirosovicensis]
MSEYQSRPKGRSSRFHGRVVHADGRRCDSPGCAEAGEFRAPRSPRPERDGYHWFCLEHVRAFNAGYDYFKGLSEEEVAAERVGHPSWERGSRPFATNANPADLNIDDPLGILKAMQGFTRRFGAGGARPDGTRLSAKDRQALKVLGLGDDASLEAIKKQYKRLARRYHPDTNGGDRSQEHQLHKVIDAYTHLSQSPAFSS